MMKKYRHISVVELRPGSTNSKRIYSKTNVQGKSSMILKKELEKKLDTVLTHNGKI